MGGRREVEHVGDIGQREALVFQQMHQFDGGIAVDPRVGRETAHLLADFREVLRRDAEFVGIITHFAVLAIVATLQHPDEAVHHLSHLCRDVSITLDAGMTLKEIDEQLLQGRHHFVAVEESVRMLHTIEDILETTTANLAFGFRQPHDRIDVE